MRLVKSGEFCCCLCKVMLQRSKEGTYADGFDQHLEIIHPILEDWQHLRVNHYRRDLHHEWASRPKPLPAR